jgi:hypothetical protein
VSGTPDLSPELQAALAKRELTLPSLKVECIYDGEAFEGKLGGGHMYFTFADTTVSMKRDGKPIGEVSGCVGGGVQLTHIDHPHQTWRVSPEALWEAFVAALPKKEKK